MAFYNAIRKVLAYSALVGTMVLAGCAANKQFTKPIKQARYEQKQTAQEKKPIRNIRTDAIELLKDSEPSQQDCQTIDSIIKNAGQEQELNIVKIYEKYILTVYSQELKSSSTSGFNHKLDVDEQRKIISLVYQNKSVAEELDSNMQGAIANMDTAILLHPFDMELYRRRAELNEQAGKEKEVMEDARLAIMLYMIKNNEELKNRVKEGWKIRMGLVNAKT